MSAVKGKKESKIILTFHSNKIEKKEIEKSLKSIKLQSFFYMSDKKEITFIDNDIVVGMYKVRLYIPFFNNPQKLNNYKKFNFSIFEKTSSNYKEINIKNDSRFNLIYKKINHNSLSNLVEAIYLCSQLNYLKAFS